MKGANTISNQWAITSWRKDLGNFPQPTFLNFLVPKTSPKQTNPQWFIWRTSHTIHATIGTSKPLNNYCIWDCSYLKTVFQAESSTSIGCGRNQRMGLRVCSEEENVMIMRICNIMEWFRVTCQHGDLITANTIKKNVSYVCASSSASLYDYERKISWSQITIWDDNPGRIQPPSSPPYLKYQ